MKSRDCLGAALRAIAATWMLVVVALSSPSAHAQMQPGPGAGWLTIASRSKPGDAIALAQRYSGRFPTAVVFQGSNGFFAVALGWSELAGGDAILADLKAEGAVPPDSYFTGGARFVRAIWTASGAHGRDDGALYAATRLGHAARSVDQGPAPRPAPREEPAPARATPMDPAPARVANLANAGESYLSLRAGPGTGFRELARMRDGTELTVTGHKGGWFEVSLDNGMRGWAFGKFVAIGESRKAPEERVAEKQADVPVIGPEEKDKEDRDSAAPQKEAKVKDDPAPKAQSKPVTDQRRVALVVGNSRYENTTELANPKNDAAAMQAKFEELGFEVITALDSSKQDMEKAVRAFVKALADADVAVFFYAGHAMQVNGRNYLIPIDAKLEDSTAIDFETIDLQVVLDFMNGDDRIAIAFLDACRDNPLSRRFARKSRSGSVGNGLAMPATEGGEMLIGFATAPGKVALDGDGSNSPFTTALLRNIGQPDVDVELMLRSVKRDVYDMTGAEQEPWHNSALRNEFFFNPSK